ncbi:hypothetical protein Y1Q_0016142 [Alligator mississippiensis]|uniref:Immunoglobulin V-set domain-containing protein n=1 Tax=Alligator mississippiensis TaxID=8496 RepID=A0A151M3M2_ALLMI|nr:hypothetical protein Y1Q_0016142 [Alligator mississippiensis]
MGFHRCKDALDLQAERFHGRTKVFPEKNGNVSLQLRDVTLNDTGTYHVYLFYHNCKPIERTFRLTVTEKPAERNSEVKGRWIAAVIVPVLILVGIIIYYLKRRQEEENRR